MSAPTRFSRHTVDWPKQYQEVVQPTNGIVLRCETVQDTLSIVGTFPDHPKPVPIRNDLIIVHFWNMLHDWSWR